MGYTRLLLSTGRIIYSHQSFILALCVNSMLWRLWQTACCSSCITQQRAETALPLSHRCSDHPPHRSRAQLGGENISALLLGSSSPVNLEKLTIWCGCVCCKPDTTDVHSKYFLGVISFAQSQLMQGSQIFSSKPTNSGSTELNLAKKGSTKHHLAHRILTQISLCLGGWSIWSLTLH
jgi:hypothetical protein